MNIIHSIMKTQCSIIIINYKSKNYLQKCLQSIRETLTNQDFTFEIIIVNNDKDKLLFEKNYNFNLIILQNRNNIGFGRANNLGARTAKGKYLFFLNPDTILVDNGLIDLVNHLEKHDGLGVIGPKIIKYSQNRPQPWTCGTKSNLLSMFFRNTINKPWNKKIPINVDWISGTALLTKRKLFEKVGGFDDNFFMYFEDQDLCLRIKNLGEAIVFYPYMSVIHFEGKSWNEHSIQKQAFYESQRQFFKKHHGQTQTLLLKILHYIIKK